MPPTIDWPTKVITVPKSDTALVSAGPPEIRSHNTDTFRLQLKDLEDSVDGMVFPHTHNHNAPLDIGGVSLARTIEITNGYTVTYENGSYAVNLTGSNNNIGDVLNLNNVQVRSSNSAGLTYSKQVEDQSFLDQRITLDTVNGQPGTAFPQGTPGQPVDNLADAQTIIANRNLPKRLLVLGSLTIGATEDISGYDISGSSSHGDSTLTFTSGSTCSHAVIRKIDVAGTPTGELHIFDAVVFGLDGFEGAMVDCGITGTIKVTNVDLENTATFINCHSMVVGVATPIIDCNSIANLDLNIRGYYGGIEIQGMTLASMAGSMDVDSANIILNANNTNGALVIRGRGSLADNSAGMTVTKIGLIEANDIRLTRQIATNKLITNPTTGVLTVRNDGDTADLKTANIYENVAGTQAYRGQGIERRDELV